MKAELVPENGDPPIPIVRDLTVVGRREYCDVVIRSPQPVEAPLPAGEDGRVAGDPGPGHDQRDEGQGPEGAMGGAVAGRSRSAWAGTRCGSISGRTTCPRPRSRRPGPGPGGRAHRDPPLRPSRRGRRTSRRLIRWSPSGSPSRPGARSRRSRPRPRRADSPGPGAGRLRSRMTSSSRSWTMTTISSTWIE